MKRRCRGAACCALFVLLAGASAARAVDPDLLAAAKRIEQFPATQGQGSESDRLKAFFDLYWSTRMRELPDLASYIGYPGLYDRLPDYSPEGLALLYRISREELKALD